GPTRGTIAIIQQSCSDSLVTASQMDGDFGSDRARSLATCSAELYHQSGRDQRGKLPPLTRQLFVLPFAFSAPPNPRQPRCRGGRVRRVGDFRPTRSVSSPPPMIRPH